MIRFRIKQTCVPPKTHWVYNFIRRGLFKMEFSHNQLQSYFIQKILLSWYLPTHPHHNITMLDEGWQKQFHIRPLLHKISDFEIASYLFFFLQRNNQIDHFVSQQIKKSGNCMQLAIFTYQDHSLSLNLYAWYSPSVHWV